MPPAEGGGMEINTADYDGTIEIDKSVDQNETINGKHNFSIPESGIESLILMARKLSDALFVLGHSGMNIILCLVRGNDICMPEKVLKLLYAKELNKLNNKRYIIVR